MKKAIILLFAIIANLVSFTVSATNYTFSNSWDLNGAPPTTLPSGDTIRINTGTLNTGNTLYTFSSGSAVIIEDGAQWNSTNIVNNSDLFWIKGTLYMFGNSTFVNNGTTIIESTGNLEMFGNGTLLNNGLFIVNGDLNLTGNGNLSNTGNIAGAGNISFSGNGSVNNSGSVNGCTGSGCIGSSGTTPLGSGSGTANTYLCGGGADAPDTLTINDQLLVSNGTCNIRSNVTVGQVLVNSSSDKLIIRNTASTSGAPTPSLTVSNLGSLNGDIINEGKIQVRNKAGIVQDAAGADFNSGSGSTKVYNNRGDTDSLKYNIWSSPIQNADLIANFSGRNPCDMYVFNASTQKWAYDLSTGTGIYTCNGNPVDFTGFELTDEVADGIMNVGRGYFMPGKGSLGSNIRFTGIMNNGDINVTVYSTNVITPGAWLGDDWNLIGNPYPSSLRADLFWADNNPILSNGVYFWDASINDYQVWNSTGGTNPTNQNIASMQGFYVLTDDGVITDGNSGTVSFTNAMRTDGSAVFYKQENSTNHCTWIDFETPSGEMNRILVGYSNSATDSFDKLYDAHKLSGNPNVRFASLLNNEEFMIQGVATPVIGETKIIPLIVFSAETGNHTFSEYKRENIPSNVNIYLRDKATSVLHDLTSGDYIVNLNGNQTYDSRFELVFVSSPAQDNSDYTSSDVSPSGDVATGVEEATKSDYTLLNEANNYTLYNSNGVKGDVQVVSITGLVVWTKSGVNATSLSIDLNGVSSGIYFMQVINNNERVYTNKIVNP